MEPKRRLVDVKEAAKMLGRSEEAVRELQWNGTLPVVRIGRRVQYEVADIEALMDQNKGRDSAHA